VSQPLGRKRGPLFTFGSKLLGGLAYLGGLSWTLVETVRWYFRDAFGRSKGKGSTADLWKQMYRVGVKSLGIVVLVQLFLGIILSLQLAPTLEAYGAKGNIPNIVSFAIFRVLGALLTGVVLSGFAGASIAAELGTMVVSEEIEAMRAMALSPVRYLVVPRVVATTAMTIALTVIADVIGVVGAYLTCTGVLGMDGWTFYQHVTQQIRPNDFITGLSMAAAFGLEISLIACHEGLRVRGGAAGVGKATTMTVVYSIVALIVTACLFTVAFFLFRI
jgi:phospholipid/cholesterol/gamma-HCH transport system permease protein